VHVDAPNNWGWLYSDGSYTIGPANNGATWEQQNETQAGKSGLNQNIHGKFVPFSPSG
jgi:hypothetical protein